MTFKPLRFLALLFLSLGFMAVPMRIAPVRGASMEPTLQDGQWLCYHRFLLPPLEPRRGEIVVFDSPIAPGHRYVKRLVGLPGDELRFEHGELWVNEVKMDLPQGAVEDHFFLSVRVPDNCFYAIGDHGDVSFDSRSFGPVPMRFLVGRALRPLTEQGVSVNAASPI